MPVRILILFGTRPEAIKLAPVIAALRRRPATFEVVTVTTGQHRELLEPILRNFALAPEHDLAVMQPNQTPLGVLARVTSQLEPLLASLRPALMMVQGDTTTTLAGALAGTHARIPVAHVEAGLRSGSVLNPFPEEINRSLTTRLSAYHLAPTEHARENLLREGVRPERIAMTGNTVVDALLATRDRLTSEPIDLSEHTPGLSWEETPVILVTGHRRESFGTGFEQICDALAALARRHPEAHIVYPVHLNPQVRGVVHRRLAGHPSIHLLPPMDYPAFVQMMMKCAFILTDSGGIQEEAPSLGKPVLVMRAVTERPETLESGGGDLVGTETERILVVAERLLASREARERRGHVAVNPHGDGRASERIADFLESHIPFSME